MNYISFRLPASFAGGGAWSAGAIAGFMGGAIEVGWIALYQHSVGRETAAVARGVTQSLLPKLATAPAAIPLGVAIHMTLRPARNSDCHFRAQAAAAHCGHRI